ncbi:MAG: 2TM domain-containing protein [Actinomycetota bacterium]
MAEKLSSPSDHELAQRRAKYLTGLLWHIGAFVIINAFFWFLDNITGEDGVQWAFWITLFWGIALLFHALAWFIDGRQLERRQTQRYLDDERRTAR